MGLQFSRSVLLLERSRDEGKRERNVHAMYSEKKKKREQKQKRESNIKKSHVNQNLHQDVAHYLALHLF